MSLVASCRLTGINVTRSIDRANCGGKRETIFVS